MKIQISNTYDGMVLVIADPDEAMDDQSIMGSNWEAPRDLDVAYAMIMDQPDLVAALEAEGYDVDDSDYSPPGGQIVDLDEWQDPGLGERLHVAPYYSPPDEDDDADDVGAGWRRARRLIEGRLHAGRLRRSARRSARGSSPCQDRQDRDRDSSRRSSRRDDDAQDSRRRKKPSKPSKPVKPRKKRKMTPAARKQMLANLAKGRKTRAANLRKSKSKSRKTTVAKRKRKPTRR